TLRSFAKVADGVYSSGQPDEKQFAYLIDHYGIKSVVKLNSDREPANSPVVKSPQIAWWSVVSSTFSPSQEQITAILAAIDCAPKPVLIHCLHGQDRTGMIVSLWRIRHGTSVKEAYADMMKSGFHTYYGGVWSAWKRETGWEHADHAPMAWLA